VREREERENKEMSRYQKKCNGSKKTLLEESSMTTKIFFINL
jgi:hypothetical protein